MVASKILQHNPDFDEKKAGKLAAEALKLAGLKLKDNQIQSRTHCFLSAIQQAEALAQLAVSEEKEKSLYKNALKEFPAIDIALFGRMVASDPSLNYDAAAQVAHSISTHKIQNEYDFFTAVDDRAPEDNDGAGHLGTTEFNVFYVIPLCYGQCCGIKLSFRERHS